MSWFKRVVYGFVVVCEVAIVIALYVAQSRSTTHAWLNQYLFANNIRFEGNAFTSGLILPYQIVAGVLVLFFLVALIYLFMKLDAFGSFQAFFGLVASGYGLYLLLNTAAIANFLTLYYWIVGLTIITVIQLGLTIASLVRVRRLARA